MKKKATYNPVPILSNSERIFLSCIDNCCHLLIERGFNGQYVFTFLDGPNGRRVNSIWNRLKNAAKVLCGKPIFHGCLIAEGADFEVFIRQLKKLQEDKEAKGHNV